MNQPTQELHLGRRTLQAIRRACSSAAPTAQGSSRACRVFCSSGARTSSPPTSTRLIPAAGGSSSGSSSSWSPWPPSAMRARPPPLPRATASSSSAAFKNKWESAFKWTGAFAGGASGSASRSSSRATTTACSTYCGAGAAASSTARSLPCSPTMPTSSRKPQPPESPFTRGRRREGGRRGDDAHAAGG
jgi:hypothetical protein